MKTISLPDGTPVPVLGQGTWKMGEDEREAAEEAAALALTLDADDLRAIHDAFPAPAAKRPLALL